MPRSNTPDWSKVRLVFLDPDADRMREMEQVLRKAPDAMGDIVRILVEMTRWTVQDLEHHIERPPRLDLLKDDQCHLVFEGEEADFEGWGPTRFYCLRHDERVHVHLAVNATCTQITSFRLLDPAP